MEGQAEQTDCLESKNNNYYKYISIALKLKKIIYSALQNS